jgi:hypothetical protein
MVALLMHSIGDSRGGRILNLLLSAFAGIIFLLPPISEPLLLLPEVALDLPLPPVELLSDPPLPVLEHLAVLCLLLPPPFLIILPPPFIDLLLAPELLVSDPPLVLDPVLLLEPPLLLPLPDEPSPLLLELPVLALPGIALPLFRRGRVVRGLRDGRPVLPTSLPRVLLLRRL